MSDISTSKAQTAGQDRMLYNILESFCRMNHVYGRVYDRRGQMQQDFFTDPVAKEFFTKRIPQEQVMLLLSSFRDYDAENVMSARTDSPSLMLRAVALRGDNGELRNVMILYGIDESAAEGLELIPEELLRTSSVSFDEGCAFLEQFGRGYFRQKVRFDLLESDLAEKNAAQKSLEQSLKRSDVMTGLLKMLESEYDFRKVAEDILKETADYLSLSDGFILRLSANTSEKGEPLVDMICEFHGEDLPTLAPRMADLPRSSVPFFTGKSYTIASDSIMPEDFQSFFLSYDITAGVFLPLYIRGELGMYLCLTQRNTPRKWSVEEIHFLNDVRRIIQTILSKRITKNSLASSYAAIDEILENTGCGIAVYADDNQEPLYRNVTFREQLTDVMDREIFQRQFVTHPGSAPEDGHDNRSREFYADGAGKWFSCSSCRINWVDGRSVKMFTLYDITQLKKYQKKIQEQADLDDLTGLYNRHRFHSDFEKYIRDAIRGDGDGTLLFLDLDDFNALNDGLGHILADRFLAMAAEALLRIADRDAQCYRIGGDQFAILIPFSGKAKAKGIVDTILSRFAKPWTLEENDYYCTVGIGVVQFPTDGDQVDVLTQRADYALHAAKKKGKNEVECYSSVQTNVPVARLDIEKAMREAVAEDCNEFEIYYQPVVDVTKPGRPCCGAEALVRWNSSKFGFMMPDKFIPLAEYLGLIVPIGEHVLIEACRRCRYWNDYGHPEYKVNVNLSIVQLMQNNIVQVIENAMDLTGITPENLTLEITEGLAIHDLARVCGTLEEIRSLGCRIALDDFGTGYSSLNHLKELPLDVIKIDKCFVNDVGRDQFSDAFIKTVSDLAGTIDVNVVVEGVEEPRQEKALDHMKIDMIQGYLYDRPLCMEDFERKYL